MAFTNSLKIIEIFGKDLVLITITSSCYYLLLHNEVDLAIDTYNYIKTIKNKLSHHITNCVIINQLTSFSLFIHNYCFIWYNDSL